MNIVGVKSATKLKQTMFPVGDHLSEVSDVIDLDHWQRVMIHNQFKTSFSGIINELHRQNISKEDYKLLIRHFKDKLDSLEKYFDQSEDYEDYREGTRKPEQALGRDISEGVT